MSASWDGSGETLEELEEARRSQRSGWPTPRATEVPATPVCAWCGCTSEAVAEYGLVHPDEPASQARFEPCCGLHLEWQVGNADWLLGATGTGNYLVVARSIPTGEPRTDGVS